MAAEIFEKCLGKKVNKKRVLHYSFGANFSNPGAVILWFFNLILFLLAVTNLVNGNYLSFILISLGSIALLGFILDIQGLEIDFKNGKIRNYQSYLGYRNGVWEELAKFEKIDIHFDKISIRRFVSTTANYSDYKRSDSYHFYTVLLIDEQTKTQVKISEESTFYRALVICNSLAKINHLTFIDPRERFYS